MKSRLANLLWGIPVIMASIATWALWYKRILLETELAPMYCITGGMMVIGIAIVTSGIPSLVRK